MYLLQPNLKSYIILDLVNKKFKNHWIRWNIVQLKRKHEKIQYFDTIDF